MSSKRLEDPRRKRRTRRSRNCYSRGGLSAERVTPLPALSPATTSCRPAARPPTMILPPAPLTPRGRTYAAAAAAGCRWRGTTARIMSQGIGSTATTGVGSNLLGLWGGGPRIPEVPARGVGRSLLPPLRAQGCAPAPPAARAGNTRGRMSRGRGLTFRGRSTAADQGGRHQPGWGTANSVLARD